MQKSQRAEPRAAPAALPSLQSPRPRQAVPQQGCRVWLGQLPELQVGESKSLGRFKTSEEQIADNNIMHQETDW